MFCSVLIWIQTCSVFSILNALALASVLRVSALVLRVDVLDPSPGMWSRSRCLGLEMLHLLMSRLGQNPQRLCLVSVSDRCVLGLVSLSEQYVSVSPQ